MKRPIPTKCLKAAMWLILATTVGLCEFIVSGDWITALISSLCLMTVLVLYLLSTILIMKNDWQSVLGGLIGGLLTGLLGLMVAYPLAAVFTGEGTRKVVVALCMAYVVAVGIRLGSVKMREALQLIAPGPPTRKTAVGIVDTSVLIDGRIADICETGFLNGALVIPEFVLKELQAIADAHESTKRSRGRRGLDIIKKMQKQTHVQVTIDSTDYQTVKEVDQKLINMARETGFPIITNDFNLNKLAEVHSIRVLNVNQLAQALRPVVLPGEGLKVQLLKEGKEHGQAVAYLDDGTMVVVENARHHIGKQLEVTVTSVLQTTAGKMIFATLKS